MRTTITGYHRQEKGNFHLKPCHVYKSAAVDLISAAENKIDSRWFKFDCKRLHCTAVYLSSEGLPYRTHLRACAKINCPNSNFPQQKFAAIRLSSGSFLSVYLSFQTWLAYLGVVQNALYKPNMVVLLSQNPRLYILHQAFARANSCIILIRTYHYFKMLPDYVVYSPSFNSFKHNHCSLPCNRVHCLLATAICVSLAYCFQQTFHRKKTWHRWATVTRERSIDGQCMQSLVMGSFRSCPCFFIRKISLMWQNIDAKVQ